MSAMLWVALVLLCFQTISVMIVLITREQRPVHRVIDVVFIIASAAGCYGVWQAIP